MVLPTITHTSIHLYINIQSTQIGKYLFIYRSFELLTKTIQFNRQKYNN